jgi:CubicO group peptidase (beta-lactamase class C family)
MHQHLHPARPRDLPEVADRVIEEFVERNAIPGASIAITTPDGSVFAGAHGHRDLATGAAATADTSYLWF